jgi:hypothetical protein
MMVGSSTHTESDSVGLPRARFAIVLLLLLGLLFWLIGPGTHVGGRFTLELTGGAVLLIAVMATTAEKRHRRTALIFGILAALLNGTTMFGFRPLGLEFGPIMSVLFAGYTTLLLLGGVMRSRRVTGDVLAGALAAYIMAGLTFAVIYGLIEVGAPGAFNLASGATASFPDLVYFSFVTLLTIGFGDVTPALPLVRAVTVFEGLFGVVYTTMVMASLVAAYLQHRGGQEPPGA